MTAVMQPIPPTKYPGGQTTFTIGAIRAALMGQLAGETRLRRQCDRPAVLDIHQRAGRGWRLGNLCTSARRAWTAGRAARFPPTLRRSSLMGGEPAFPLMSRRSCSERTKRLMIEGR
jgi:hypothetical protein